MRRYRGDGDYVSVTIRTKAVVPFDGGPDGSQPEHVLEQRRVAGPLLTEP